MKTVRSLLYILTLALVIPGCSDIEPQSPASISFYIGDVTINKEKASVGMTVSSGDTVITGPRSSCDIAMGKSVLRLKESSLLEITESVLQDGMEKSDITLENGSLLCKPKKLIKGEEFIVRTKTSVAAVRGTQFAVRTDANQTTRIKVFEGTVKVAPRIARLDETPEKLLEYGTAIPANKAAVISTADATEANEALTSSIAQGKSIDDALRTNSEAIAIKNERIEEFEASDFIKEMELIKLQPKKEPKPKPVVKKKKRIIPKKLVVSRYEIYKVQQGKIVERSQIMGRPVTYNNRVYAASKNRIFAADANGTILWEKPMTDIERIARIGQNLSVRTASGSSTLSLATGKPVQQ